MTAGPARADLAGVEVVVVSSEQPGRLMAGPAIRATHLARELGRAGARVTLACTAEPDVDLGVPTRVIGPPDPRTYRRLARGCDVLMIQPQRVDVAAGLHRGTARIVYDLYVPYFVEYPASVLAARGSGRTARKLIERNHREVATAVSCGDGFLVASDRQRDFLWGALGQAGRLQYPPAAHAEAARVAVVPFGLPDADPPRQATGRLRGQLVPADAVIALWAGGVWNWFDPLTVVRAVAAARVSDPRVHLVFLGSGHPSADFQGQDAATAALAAPEVGALLEDGGLVFVDEWVPYEDRGAYLTEADLGVCAFFDSPETRMSFRTRLLDHLWAGLPTLTTQGGVLSDRMVAAGAAVELPPGDVDAWRDMLVALADDRARRGAMAASATALAPDYRWSRVAEPLVGLVADLAAHAEGPGARPAARDVLGYLAVAVENRLR
ncbi:MAG: hypothetical protein U0R64_01215 [Candidatus Nanopelagicales bacterium]